MTPGEPRVDGAGDETAPWSNLWSTGVLHSCATGIDGNYDGPIGAFWQRQFDRLESGARVADLGTGNGALLLLAGELAARRGIALQMHGVDLADIDPPKTAPGEWDRFPDIHFHPRTSACQLPFADGELDLICSQFGFEYFPRHAALEEVARVARPRSRIALVLHSDDSVIAQVAVSQHEGYRFLRETSPVIVHARALAPVLFQASRAGGPPRPTPESERLRLAFNQSARELMDAIERWPHAQVLKNTARLLGTALQHAARSVDDAQEMLSSLEASLRDEAARNLQQQRAQISPAGVLELAGQLRELGYDVAHAGLEQRPGVKIGWTVEATRG